MAIVKQRSGAAVSLRAPGRPAKESGEKFLIRSFRIPPDVWDLVMEHIPEGERSAAVVEGLRRAAIKNRKTREHLAVLTRDGFREPSEQG